MRIKTDKLGKSCITIEREYHSIDKEYDRLTIVEEKGAFVTYVSRKPVPAGIQLTDREYWIPFSGIKESIVLNYTEFKAEFLRAEAARVLAENQRVTNETHREENEVIRQQQEHSRQTYEQQRATSENARKSSENTRINNEIARSDAERQRQQNESSRNQNESERISNEVVRNTNEGNRVHNEEVRQENETVRGQDERTRQENETIRQEQEGSSEDTASAIGSRWARYKQAESDRTTLFNQTQISRQNNYNQAEGTSEDTASDNGSRWARFKKAEEARDSLVEEKVGDITKLQEEKADKDTNAVEGHVAIFDSNGNPVDGGILNEGVYDVSEKNPTGGPNSDGKFTLEYILSNANTLIPDSVRKGGMSIKFVHTSDNKYVQYRLMSDTFSITESDWQGVDDKPAAGSDNLVKSGGVHDLVEQSTQSLHISLGELVTGAYINKYGNPTTATNGRYYTYTILSDISSLILEGTAIGGDTSSIAFYSSNIVSGVQCIGHYTFNGNIKEVINVPISTKLIAVSAWKNLEDLKITQIELKVPSEDNIKNAILEEVTPQINALDEEINGKTEEDALQWQTSSGGYITSVGGVIRNTSTKMLLMDITLDGQNFIKTVLGHSANSAETYKYLVFLDNNNVPFSYGSYTNWDVAGVETHIDAIPENATKVVIYNYNVVLETPTITLITEIEGGLKDEIQNLEDEIQNLDEQVSNLIVFESIDKPFIFSGKKLVAFGDSITYGVSSPMSESHPYTNGYIYKFANNVGAILDNRAKSGSTITQGRVQFGSIYEKVLEYTGDADIIWIAGGVNDALTATPIGNYTDTTPTTFYGALRGICEYLKNNFQSAKVIFVSPIPLTRTDKPIWHIDYSLNDYRKAIYEIATEYGYSVVNGAGLGMPNSMGGWSNFMVADTDGCHPTPDGHSLYARSLCGKLL